MWNLIKREGNRSGWFGDEFHATRSMNENLYEEDLAAKFGKKAQRVQRLSFPKGSLGRAPTPMEKKVKRK